MTELPEANIQLFEKKHHAWAKDLLGGHMGTYRTVSRGVLYDPLKLPGYVAVDDGEPVALVTYRIDGKQCEILTLHSQREGEGYGTALVDRVREQAIENRCERLWLITTNDNIYAIGWYQRRGFELAAIHRNALERSRELKPEIPEVGFDGIPLRDELEFEIMLASS